jgi:isoleucyl-tRNA synthetase
MRINKAPKSINFPEIEKEVSAFWDAQDIFAKSIQNRPESRKFRFYDGPPFATGLPHFGHFVPNSIKDAFPRYFTMKNHRVERRFGWDCHGLPVEMLVQKDLGLNGRADIEAYGIEKFNEACRRSVLRYAQEWRVYMKRLGRWVDSENEYRTMDKDFMESVWAVFRSLWDKGLVYKGFRVMSYSTALGSSLSNFEASLDYRDVQDPSITVKARLIDGPCAGACLLVWTTTPWTLPANLAVAIDGQGAYVEIRDSKTQEKYVLLESRLGFYWKSDSEYEVLRKFAGESIAGSRYEPFYVPTGVEHSANMHRVLAVGYVLHDTGSGAVHTAPAFGEDDYNCAQQYDLAVYDHLDANGRFVQDVPNGTQGLLFKETDKIICQDLKSRGLMFRHETYVHAYPMCYRSGTPLIYRAQPSWFVRVEAIKDKILKNNDEIRWVPAHVQTGRFGKWLENARDWNVARARYWGNPLPIWEDAETGETRCFGSVEELEKASGRTISDLHIEHLEGVEVPSLQGGRPLRRVPFVLDCWFESGSMPYAQQHFPFENVDKFHSEFPADFICEGLDQTRGWFYTLNVLSTALFDKPAFRNVVVNGLVLAEDGKKMSKSLKNYPDPMETLDQCGADSVRLYLLNSPATFGEEVRFSIENVKENTRRVLLPLWNAFSFFSTYASIDGFDPELHLQESNNELDRWILCKLQVLLQQIDDSMNRFEIAQACPLLVAFLDDLNNWYIRRNRRRFWSSDFAAHSTLFRVLTGTVQLLAPFAPFVADYFYRSLSYTKEMQATESVHLSLIPDARQLSSEESDLLERVALARRVVELGRNIRVGHKIRIRQPLANLTIGVVTESARDHILAMEGTIRDELNVKTLSITSDPSSLASVFLKPDFKVLGKKLGPAIKELQSALSQCSSEVAAQALNGEPISVGGFELQPGEYLVELRPAGNRLVATDRELVASLDPEISEELKREGLARELVSHIQRMRKVGQFEVEERIQLFVAASDLFMPGLLHSRGYIEDETLSAWADSAPVSVSERCYSETVQLDTETVSVTIWKE